MLNIQNWKKGQAGQGVQSGGLDEKMTTPPKPYDEAMLLRDMEGAARFIKNDALRESMKKADGIGTPATRAAVIEKLKTKTGDRDIQFFKEVKNKLRATPEGDRIIAALEGSGPAVAGLTDVVMTAMWEGGLKQVETGALTYQAFMAKQESYVRQLVESATKAQTGLRTEDAESGPSVPCADVDCDKDGTLTWRKGKFGYFWACSKRSEGCNCKIGDSNGKPFRREAQPLEEIEPLPGSGDKCPTCKKANLTTRKVSNPDSKAFGKRMLVCTNRSCKFIKGEWVFEKEASC